MAEVFISEKQSQRKKLIKKIKIYSLIFIFIALISSVFYLVAYSSIFKIKDIEVVQISDSEKVDSNKVLENYKAFLINQSKLNSFLGIDNILIWQNKYADLFLKNNPELSRFEISKSYSARRIKITLEGRQKLGIWCEVSQQDQNQAASISGCYWFDKTGIIFENAPYVEGELVYKINDFSNRSLKLGDFVIDKNLFTNLIKIFEVLDKANIKTKNFILNNMGLEEIETSSSFAPKIYFSLRFDPSFTLPAFNALEKSGLDKIEYIDFRVENRAYYKNK